MAGPPPAKKNHFAGGSARSDAQTPDISAAQVSALRAIVDHLDYGVVVLDPERRVEFVNRAFRRFWRLPESLAESDLTFIKLMYHARGADAYAVSHDRLGDYVTKQLELIRAGDERPLRILLRSGEVLQFRCTALGDGRKLLTYGRVSELVREAEALEQLACVDGMTGLNNRRHFLVLAQAEWSRSKRYERPMGLLMLDIDFFKSVNDKYGHDSGDEVIRSVADTLREHKRSSDIAGRLGGEEFAMILPEATIERAAAAGERLRRLVADLEINVEDHQIAATVSIGAASCHAGTIGLDELLKQADIALYDAKRSGRNCVRSFDPSRFAPAQAHAP